MYVHELKVSLLIIRTLCDESYFKISLCCLVPVVSENAFQVSVAKKLKNRNTCVCNNKVTVVFLL